MSQFDYLRAQMGDGWINKELLKIPDSAKSAIGRSAEWYFALPHIKFIMENTVMGNVKELLMAGQDLTGTVTDCGLVFLETVYGVNKAFNSKVHKNLAGKGQSILAGLSSTAGEKILYNAAVTAHNESLNLPELSVRVAEIEAEIASIQAQFDDNGKNEALEKLRDARDQILSTIDTLIGKAKSSAKRKLKIAETGIARMTGTAPPVVIAHNFYSFTSIYNRPIISTYNKPPVLNTIVPIAVGGAITVGATAGIITSIASWLLGSFFLRGITGGLLSGLANTVTSIVLKVMGSSGADAMRYIAASALKANKSLLPVILGITGMEASAWGYLIAHASLIIGAAVIIIQAMKNKLSVAEMLYIFGNIEGSTTYNLTQVHMYDTNHVEILDTFKNKAMQMYDESTRTMEAIIGVGLNTKKEYTVAYDLTDPYNPQRISGNEAIATTLGAEKVAKLLTGDFFDFFE
ncbi:hypothetical protein QUB63_35000 [Microcoleus sp. ARI1-B5]|uniref:hypothetical protein n=1 Tax=unclassified Microcoleus TaxID=2642155 RepID=UPI002FD6515F